MIKYLQNYATQAIVVFANLLIIGLCSRYLTPPEFAKFLTVNLLISLAIIFESGAGPVFSKSKKNNLSSATQKLKHYYYKRIITFLMISVILFLLLQSVIKNYGNDSVFGTVTFIEYLLILTTCLLKVSFAPNRGIILGSEKFSVLLVLQLIDFISKIFIMVLLLSSDRFNFANLLFAYIISHGIVLAYSHHISKKLPNTTKQQDPKITYCSLKKEFKTISIGTSVWILFSNLDKLIIAAISNQTLFSTYSIASTIGSFQNNIFGPAVPVIGQRLLQRQIDKYSSFQNIIVILFVGISVFGFTLVALHMFGEQLIQIWLGNNISEPAKIVKFAMWLSLIPVCNAGNGLAFNFQFAFNDMTVFRYMNFIAPITTTVVLLFVLASEQLEILPMLLGLSSTCILISNLLWIGLRLEKY